MFDKEEYEKCLRGELYNTEFEGRNEVIQRAHDICHKYNTITPSDIEKRRAIIKELFYKTGEDIYVEAPVYVDCGFNIEVGDHFFANFSCTFVDVNKIIFGNNVFIGPNCSFYTAGHPLDYKLRNQLYEYAYPIVVGDNVWFGGNVVVCPGVHIGNNVVIAAGSVVNKDIPDNCMAAGNPCKIKKQL